MPTTLFTERAAVDAWDKWFRWRSGDGVHDRTIDATWWRVADALAPDAAAHRQWAYRYVEAFSRWQLLPDERLLGRAGTDAGMTAFTSPRATLNVAGFISAPRTSNAHFDRERFANVAALAVRLLDDALVAMHGPAPRFADLRIGLMGMGNALQMLGIPYGDPAAIGQTRIVGSALALGTLRGNIELARERGPIDALPRHRRRTWLDRGTPEKTVEEALMCGIRHSRVTAIDLQPRLALLANDASDALDLPRARSARARPTFRPAPPDVRPAMGGDALVTAQLAIRAAIQPWIDAPIEYPLTMDGEESDGTLLAFTRLADAYGLHTPSFRGQRP